MNKQRKVAVITGASQGIGEGLVEAYRARGFRVAATSRTIALAETEDLLTLQGDIGDAATGPRVITEALRKFGRVDTLVNNAGIFLAKPFTRYDAEDYARALATNLNGFFFTTQAAVEAMEKQGAGHVVSITTALVEHPLAAVPSVLASLTKGGIDAATRSLATEYATRGVRVNAVAPGVINTPMHAPDTHEALGALHPVRRIGQIEDVVGAVLYLEDAGFVTGATINVDGGQTAGH